MQSVKALCAYLFIGVGMSTFGSVRLRRVLASEGSLLLAQRNILLEAENPASSIVVAAIWNCPPLVGVQAAMACPWRSEVAVVENTAVRLTLDSQR